MSDEQQKFSASDEYIYVICVSELVTSAKASANKAFRMREHVLKKGDEQQATVWWCVQNGVTTILHSGRRGIRVSTLRRRITSMVSNKIDDKDSTVDLVMATIAKEVKVLSDRQCEMLGGRDKLVISNALS